MTPLAEKIKEANCDYEARKLNGNKIGLVEICSIHGVSRVYLTEFRSARYARRRVAFHRNQSRRELVELANADYDDQMQDKPYGFNMRDVERHWGIKAGSIRNFRSNNLRKKP